MTGSTLQYAGTTHRTHDHASGSGRTRRASKGRLVWYAIVPSAFVVTLAGLMWLDGGRQASSSIAAAQPAVATTTSDFLHAPAGDPSVPRASDVLNKPEDDDTPATF